MLWKNVKNGFFFAKIQNVKIPKKWIFWHFLVNDRNDFFGFRPNRTETESRPPKPSRNRTETKNFEFFIRYRITIWLSLFISSPKYKKVHWVHLLQKITQNQPFFIVLVIWQTTALLRLCKHSFDTDSVGRYVQSFLLAKNTK